MRRFKGTPSTAVGRPLVPHTPPAKGYSIPAPTWGWDASSSIANMAADHAIELVNWFPQTESVEVRKGFGFFADVGTGDPVESLMAYQGAGADALFAASDGTIFDITGGMASASITGLVNSRFQNVNFSTTGGDFLWICNGADTPRYFDGSAWATATITGVSSSQIVNVEIFKGRLWLALNDSLSAAYLPVDSIQGAATVFDLQGVFNMGGYLMAMGTWTLDGGNGPDDYLAFLTSRGQLAVYSGVNPEGVTSDFTLIAVVNIGSPIGRRCMTKVGSDLVIISIDGVLPISKAVVIDRAAAANAALTTRIQRVMNISARDYGDNFGWQLIGYPRGTRALLNVPIVEGDQQEQYAMNTITGAWSRFTGQNANCWELLNDRLFFGGNEGVIYEADIGGADFGQDITADLRTAFNYFGNRGHEKRFTMARAITTTDGSTAPGIAFNVDYREDAQLTSPVSSGGGGALWDIALWDIDIWPIETRVVADWQTVTGVGTCASARMSVTVEAADISMIWDEMVWGEMIWAANSNAPITLALNGFDVRLERGGLL